MIDNHVIIKIELYITAPSNGAPLEHLGHRDVIVAQIEDGVANGEIAGYTVFGATATRLRLTPMSQQECYAAIEGKNP